MRRETLGGWCLICGSILTLATMALHPTGADIARAPASEGAVNVVAHAMAIAALPILLYGAFVLTRRLATAGAGAELALAAYGLATMATLVAGTASGFLAPPLIRQAVGDTGVAQATAAALLHYNGATNQAFARIAVAASLAAIVVWSWEIVRWRALARGTGIYGLVAAITALTALLSGHLPLNVHGMGAVVLLQAAWFIAAGVELRRRRSAE